MYEAIAALREDEKKITREIEIVSTIVLTISNTTKGDYHAQTSARSKRRAMATHLQ